MKHFRIFTVILLFGILTISCRDHSREIPGNTINESENIITNWITVSKPAYGEVWRPGTTHTIKWKSNTEIKRVVIDVFKKGSYRFNINPEVENTGSYTWIIPTDVVQSNHYQIRISNVEDGEHEGFSEVFYLIRN